MTRLLLPEGDSRRESAKRFDERWGKEKDAKPLRCFPSDSRAEKSQRRHGVDTWKLVQSSACASRPILDQFAHPFPFSQAAEPDYETVLSQLESSIKARESHLLSIKLRERRANALFVTYGLAAYLLYALLWYFSFRATPDPLDKALVLAPVVGGPIVYVSPRTYSFPRSFVALQHHLHSTHPRILVPPQARCRGSVS